MLPLRLIRRAVALLAATVMLGAAAAAAPIETSAREALLVDFTTGTVLYEKNADELMPPSSMSKLMTAYMVFERLKQGRLSLEDTFPVSERAWRKQGSKMFVAVGSRVKVEDLLRGIIVQSGNDACIVVAEGLANDEQAFAELMTRRAREIGLADSVFRNATGWPDPEHVMTARDLATLARRIILDFPEYYKYYAETNFKYNDISQGNRNPLLYKNMGADGLKTGHTEAAGYGLTASAQRNGRRLILVVNGLPSVKARSEESERLLEWGFREFENVRMFAAGDVVSEAEVWLGEQAKVPLLSKEDVEFTFPRHARRTMKVAAVFEGPLPAPIKKGQEVAKLVISVPDGPTREVPLYAGADVAKLGFAGRIGSAVKHIVFGSN
ncbi:MAG: D-alanyl-D-alanine carboxypeptidase [Rhodospirillales bacterium]|nr:D-alanyl-D-alanine carboxypeptidase [Rhodospirillales bacterium]